jgi:hypothetical protein
MDRRLGGAQRRSGYDVEEKIFQPPPGIEPRSSDGKLIIIGEHANIWKEVVVVSKRYLGVGLETTQ